MGKGVVWPVDGNRIAFYCPACRGEHQVLVPPDPKGWDFNGDVEKPTLTPSIKVSGVEPLTDAEYERVCSGGLVEPRPRVCHFYVTAGKIQYCSDSSHELAGETVALQRPM